MKKLLAVCMTALHAVWLAPGRNSVPRHAHKRLRFTRKSLTRKAVGASLATVLAVGMIGAAMAVPTASANDNSYWNHAANWQPLYPGSSCYKMDKGFSGPSYVLPALDSTKNYVAVIVNAGSDSSTGGHANNVFDATQNVMPSAGVIVSSYDGKDISHIIICTVAAPPTAITPAAVTFTPAACTTPGDYGQGSYTIPGTSGVQYQLKTGSSSWADLAAGTTLVSVGTTVTIRAIAASSSYVLNGTQQWSQVIAAPGGSCDVAVTAVVTFADAVCTGPGISAGTGSYTITAQTGVIYQISGTPVLPGTVSMSVGSSVTITAIATHGYTLTGATTWTHEFVSAGACLASVTVIPATSVDNSCTTVATLTLPSIAGVVWTVNGGVASAGTYPMRAGGPNTVVASAAPGYILTAPYSENFTFAPAVTCVTPVGPTFGAASCDAASGVITGGYIVIPSATGISYYIDGHDAAAGPHTVSDGAHTVTAVADAHYQLLGGIASWPVTIDGAGTCAKPASITADPAVVQPQCINGNGTTLVSGYITVTVTDHVTYSITGTTDGNAAVSLNNVGARTDLAPGHYTVKATADVGFALAGVHVGPWDMTITAYAGDCGQIPTLAFLPSAVSSANPVCTAGGMTEGSITVAQANGTNEFGKGISYFIDGVKVTSITTAKAPGTYHVTASVDDPLDSIDGDSAWTITIASPSASCGQLTTLAFTGADGTASARLIIALFLLLCGAGAYTASRLRMRES